MMDESGQDENKRVFSFPKKLIERRPIVRRKYIPIEPFNFTLFGEPDGKQAEYSSTCKKSGDRRPVTRRKYIHIEPIRFNFPDIAEPENPSKKPKIETPVLKPVRKELFKLPQKRFSSINGCGSTNKSRGTANNINEPSNPKNKTNLSKKKITVNDGSPLFDAEEAEELLCQNKPITKNTIKTVLFPMTSIKEEESHTAGNNSTPLKSLSVKDEVTPTSSQESEREFLELERQLASVKKSAKKIHPSSPMTSVCTLLAKTNITLSGGNASSQNTASADILSLIAESQEQMQLMKHEFDEKFQVLQQKLEMIKELVERSQENKENMGRRSVKINQPARKFVISPAISTKVDLRKSTLNKNLSRHVSCDSPTMLKAVDRYNSMRNDCRVLCTPKMDRSNIDVPQGSVTRSLSRRIQKQCLLLQEPSP